MAQYLTRATGAPGTTMTACCSTRNALRVRGNPLFETEMHSVRGHCKINDWTLINMRYYHYVYINNCDKNLVYKSDIFALGNTFRQLVYFLKSYLKIKKNIDYNNLILNNLIDNMIFGDVRA